MLENQRSPGGFADDGVEQRDQALPAVEEREFQRQRGRLTDFDAGCRVFRQSLAVRLIERTAFDQEAAGDPVQARLADEHLVEWVYCVRRARKLEIFARYFREHPA